MRIELHNLDGTGFKKCHVYDLIASGGKDDYWASVTDVPCPIKSCNGIIRWAEAGYVSGYRICENCGRHFLAKGNANAPTLIRVGNRFSPRKKIKPLRYTCTGSVRGNCGHRHLTIGAALNCCKKDTKACVSQGGYSDYSIVRTDDKDMTEQEIQEIQEIEDNLRVLQPFAE